MVAELTRRAIAELGEDAGPLDYAEMWVASGNTILALANDLSATLSVTFLREQVTRYLHSIEGAEERLTRARTRSARGLAEEALDIVDKASAESREALTKAKMQADVRHWMAERYDRDAFGQKQQTNVAISLNVLHLDALRARAVRSRVSSVENGLTENVLEATLGEVPQLVGTVGDSESIFS